MEGVREVWGAPLGLGIVTGRELRDTCVTSCVLGLATKCGRAEVAGGTYGAPLTFFCFELFD